MAHNTMLQAHRSWGGGTKSNPGHYSDRLRSTKICDMQTDDTIVAISSPGGSAARGIIRLSGPLSWAIATSLLRPVAKPQPFCWIDAWLDEPALPVGLMLFQAPRSFTGQDIAELHIPGSPALLALIMDKLLAKAARQAEGGEYSARAFLHGKLDLTEAEGIAATISARTNHQLRAAASLRQGSLHRWVQQQADTLADILALVEAGIDFSDEPGVSFIALDQLQQRLYALSQSMQALETRSVSWEALAAMPTVVLLGRPNVGKSSLLNALSGQERAIVSPVAGTTRDAISVELSDASRSVRLVDAAGVETNTTSMAELMNDARRQTLLRADVILLVVDHTDTQGSIEALMAEIQDIHVWKIIVRNKSDLSGGLRSAPPTISLPWINVAAKTGDSLSALRELVFDLAHRQAPVAEDCLTLNSRHQLLLRQARSALERAEKILASSGQFPELLAADLRAALDDLGAISGTISSDDVLGRIFSSFCIGK